MSNEFLSKLTKDMAYVMQTSIDPVLFCKYYHGKIEADLAYTRNKGQDCKNPYIK